MTEIRWGAIVTFENSDLSIDAEFTTDGQFNCSNIAVQHELNIDVHLGEKVNPIGVLPPKDSLMVSYKNPASVAADFYRIVMTRYKAKNPHFIFSGSCYLIPGMELDGDDENGTDFYDSNVVASLGKTFFPSLTKEFNPDEERDYHGRWTSNGDGTVSMPAKDVADGDMVRFKDEDSGAIKDAVIYARKDESSVSFRDNESYDLLQTVDKNDNVNVVSLNPKIGWSSHTEEQSERFAQTKNLLAGTPAPWTPWRALGPTGNMSQSDWDQVHEAVKTGAPISQELQDKTATELRTYWKNYNDAVDKWTSSFSPDMPRYGLGKEPDYVNAAEKALSSTLIFAGTQLLARGGLNSTDYPSNRLPGMLTVNMGEPLRFSIGAQNAKIGMMSQEDEMNVRSQVSAALKDAHPTIRMSSAALGKVLADGVIRNQAEVGRTSAAGGKTAGVGSDYNAARIEGEYATLGVLREASPEQRPVYGFMDGSNRPYRDHEIEKGTNREYFSPNNPNDVVAALRTMGGFGTNNSDDLVKEVIENPDNYVVRVSSYREDGHSVTVLPEVMSIEEALKETMPLTDGSHRSTNDKFNDGIWQRAKIYPVGDGKGHLNGDTLASLASLHDSYTAAYGGVKVVLNDNVLSRSTLTSGDSLDGGSPALPADLTVAGDSRVPMESFFWGKNDDGSIKINIGAYIETQTLGRIGLGDIAKVVYTGEPPKPAQLKALAAANIPVENDGPSKPLSSYKMNITQFVEKYGKS